MSVPQSAAKVRVVILAAGKGTRMKSDLPKVLTPIGGKPILAHLLASVMASDLDPRPLIVVGYMAEDVRAAIGEGCDYVLQPKALGTGQAVATAMPAVGDADAVVVLYGDHPFISAKTMRRLVARHEERKNTLTLMTTTIPDFEGWHAAFERWGRILRGADGHITDIREFKDATDAEKEIHELNPALLCFDAAWLRENIGRLGNKNAQEEFYLTDLIAMAVEQGRKLSSVSVDPEEVVGINTPQERAIAETILGQQNG